MQRLADERGSALLSTLAVTGVAVLGIALLLDVFGICVAKRTGRTAADAAALGALQAAEQSFNQVLEPAVQIKVNELLQAVGDEVSRRMGEWEEDRRTALRESLENQVPPLPGDVIERRIVETIADERPGKYQSTHRSVVRSMVRDPSVGNALTDGRPVPPLAGLGEFFTAKERGCLVRAAGEQGMDEMQTAARWFAQQNGGQESVTVTFPYQNQIKVRVVVPVPVPLGLTARFAPAGETLLPVEASSKAADLGIPFDLSGPC